MTAYTFSQILPISNPPKFETGMEYRIDFEYSLGTGLASGDTISTPALALPGDGIRITDIEISHPELDTNATPTGTYNIGDADDADRFLASAIMGMAGVTTAGALVRNRINRAQGLTSGVVSTGSGYLYPVDTSPVLILAVNAAVATAASSGVIRMSVLFNCTAEQ